MREQGLWKCDRVNVKLFFCLCLMSDSNSATYSQPAGWISDMSRLVGGWKRLWASSGTLRLTSRNQFNETVWIKMKFIKGHLPSTFDLLDLYPWECHVAAAFLPSNTSHAAEWSEKKRSRLRSVTLLKLKMSLITNILLLSHQKAKLKSCSANYFSCFSRQFSG